MIVYKVVKQDAETGELTSLLTKQHALRYGLGVETRPKFGKILAFGSFKAAEYFRQKHGGVVFLARAASARLAQSYDRIGNLGDQDRWPEMWASPIWFPCMLPEGTVFCDSLHLMKQLF